MDLVKFIHGLGVTDVITVIKSQFLCLELSDFTVSERGTGQRDAW